MEYKLLQFVQLVMRASYISYDFATINCFIWLIYQLRLSPFPKWLSKKILLFQEDLYHCSTVVDFHPRSTVVLLNTGIPGASGESSQGRHLSIRLPHMLVLFFRGKNFEFKLFFRSENIDQVI